MRDTVQRLFTDPTGELFTVTRRGKPADPRPVQCEYALAVHDAITAGGGGEVSVALLQGETGIGKSLGYLIPVMLEAAAQGKRVVISTHTIALQRQIYEETLPDATEVVASITGKHLAFGMRVGRRNFISLPAFERLTDAAERETGTNPMLRRMLDFMRSDPLRSTVQAIQEEFSRDIEDAGGLPFSLDACRIGQDDDDSAGYKAMVESSKFADVLVINHALLVIDIMSKGKILSDGTERGVLYVIDEADALREVVNSLLSRRLPMADLHAFKRLVKGTGSKRFTTLNKAVAALDAAIEAAVKMDEHKFPGSTGRAEILPITGQIDQVWRDTFSNLVTAVMKEVRRIRSELDDNAQVQTDAAEILLDIEDISLALKSIKDGRGTYWIPALYWTPARRQPGILLSGGRPEGITSNIWRREEMRAHTVILTSATLSGGGNRNDREDLREFAIGIGMSNKVYETATRGLFAPTNFGRMNFVIVDQATAPSVTISKETDDEDSSPETNPEAVKWWVAMIRAAAKEDNGRILVLALSYKDAKLIAEELGDIPDWNIVLDQRGRSDAVSSFKRQPRSILISPGKWEGLDLPGMIRHIVMPRIPFSPPDVVQNAVFEAYLADKGASLKQIRARRFPAMLSKARRKMNQGMGRGRRRVDDEVTIWIGDWRWPVSRLRVADGAALRQPRWSGGMEFCVPERFRANLARADGFTPARGRFEAKPQPAF